MSEHGDNARVPETVLILGAGPAGLTAALELTKRAVQPVVLEADHIVGGISRTENYRGYRFDMGGHRFFTKSSEVQALWHELLGDDFLLRPRLSRIYYNRKFFDYPLKPLNAMRGLGFLEGTRIVASFVRWQIKPHRPEESFEHWVTNRFGARLFHTFFRAYTEKVWGIRCSELKAEWAAQRIKDLSLRSVVANMFSSRGPTIKTLIEQFHYPRLGPGMMWGQAQASIDAGPGRVRLNSEVVRLHREGYRITAVDIRTPEGEQRWEAPAFISSLPVTALVARLSPPAPDDVRAAAAGLNYRSFLTVCLIVDQPDLFPDNWIYIQDPDVTVGRIQNFKNWSPDMVPNAAHTSLGMEYFCNEGDALWCMPDNDLIELAKRELETIGLGRAVDVIDGCVYRVPKSYPVYDTDYAEHLAVVRDFVDQFENLQTIGRNGLHRYNNQDHAMMTGSLAVANLLDDAGHDLWQVNAEQEYHEEVALDADTEARATATLSRELARLDPLACGVAVGSVAGCLLLLMTLARIWQAPAGPPLELLAQYFPGYRVSIPGALLGAGYTGLLGLGAGWFYAVVRNFIPRLWVRIQARRFELPLIGRLFDFIDRRRP